MIKASSVKYFELVRQVSNVKIFRISSYSKVSHTTNAMLIMLILVEYKNKKIVSRIYLWKG